MEDTVYTKCANDQNVLIKIDYIHPKIIKISHIHRWLQHYHQAIKI